MMISLSSTLISIDSKARTNNLKMLICDNKFHWPLILSAFKNVNNIINNMKNFIKLTMTGISSELVPIILNFHCLLSLETDNFFFQRKSHTD